MARSPSLGLGQRFLPAVFIVLGLALITSGFLFLRARTPSSKDVHPFQISQTENLSLKNQYSTQNFPELEQTSARFRGTVKNQSTGEPIPNAIVSLIVFPASKKLFKETDSQGYFEFQLPSTGTARIVSITREQYIPFFAFDDKAVEINLHAGLDFVVEFTLNPEITCKGLVISPKKEGIESAQLHIIQTLFSDESDQNIYTDSEGRFEIPTPKGKPIRILIEHSEYESQQIAFQNCPENLEIHLNPKNSPDKNILVEGRIIDQSDNVIEGAFVYLRGPMHPDGRPKNGIPLLFSGVSDQEGSFSIRVQSTDHYALQTEAKGYAELTQIIAAPRTGLVLRLEPESTFEGSVHEQATGNPISQFRIIISTANKKELKSLPFIDPEGIFSIHGLHVGEYVVRAEAQGFAPSDIKTFNLKKSERYVHNFELGNASHIRGKVIREVDHIGIPNATVRVEGINEQDTLLSPIETTSRFDGTFELHGIPKGLVSVEAQHEQYHRRINSGIEIHENQTKSDLILQLKPRKTGEPQQIDFAGIGAVISQIGKGYRIDKLLPGSGAAEAGIREGDVIMRVNGVALDGYMMREAVSLLRGEENTAARLEIVRQGQIQEFIVLRRRLRS